MTLPISFEFFPPKTDVGADKLLTIAAQFQAFKPDYFSVTYGAGGSTRERTLSIVSSLNGQGAPIRPHLSCIGDSRAHIADLLTIYQAQGLSHLVALRGDLPSRQVGLGELPYARDLVEFIRAKTGDYFHIAVAAYPEMHPQAPSFALDMDYLAQKFNAGANSAITQFFFNADSYFYLSCEMQKRGIDKPIVAGIMPIIHASNLIRFSDACGADIPRWIRKKLADYGDDSASIKAFGLEVVVKLCERLIAGGVPSLHFYSMNQYEPTAAIIDALNLSPSATV